MKHLVWTSETADQLTFTEYGFEVKAPRDLTLPYEQPSCIDTGVSIKSRHPYILMLESNLPLCLTKSFRMLEANKPMQLILEFQNYKHFPNFGIAKGEVLARFITVESDYAYVFRMNPKEFERY